ncbi:peptide deformylase [Arthrobacter tumbae]|uniref:peptide deformylase n=1 Tax=Arthrobacter tumbae TaxID=163874 RepID=UPI00195C2BD1|nr:peptide deformylase [Arthrobacter tumbae]MBM7783144.1 peptide deformylase [Arthrobacter tumbae]
MNLSTRENIRALVRHVVEQEQPPIVQLGDPVLRNPAVPFDGQLDDSELTGLLAVMRRAMHDAPGVGLAAPQLGIPLRLAVIEDIIPQPDGIAELCERPPLPYFAVINPAYTPIGRDTSSFFEGCLSFSGWQAVVERHRTVQLEYQTPEGMHVTRQFTGWSARIVQHETDHLNGAIYIDKANTRSLVSSAAYSEHWAQPGIELAQRSLNF